MIRVPIVRDVDPVGGLASCLTTVAALTVRGVWAVQTEADLPTHPHFAGAPAIERIHPLTRTAMQSPAFVEKHKSGILHV